MTPATWGAILGGVVGALTHTIAAPSPPTKALLDPAAPAGGNRGAARGFPVAQECDPGLTLERYDVLNGVCLSPAIVNAHRAAQEDARRKQWLYVFATIGGGALLGYVLGGSRD